MNHAHRIYYLSTDDRTAKTACEQLHNLIQTATYAILKIALITYFTSRKWLLPQQIHVISQKIAIVCAVYYHNPEFTWNNSRHRLTR